MKKLSILLSLLLFFGEIAAGITPQQQVDLHGARELITQGQCLAAISRLDRLILAAPAEPQFKLALKDAYICAEDYEKAGQLLEEMIAAAAHPLVKAEYMIAAADLVLKQGDKPQADSMLAAAIATTPAQPNVYQFVAQTYMRNGYYNDAAATYLQARSYLKDDYWYARELGRLYEIMRDYGDAAREYFRAVEGDTLQARYVVGRVASMINAHTGEDFDTGLGVELENIAREYPDNSYAHKFYADFLIANGRHAEALRHYILTDSLAADNGAQIVHFCRIAGEAGEAQAVFEARAELRLRYPESPHLTNAAFILGNVLYENRRFADAISVYQEIADSSKQTQDKGQALLMLGFVIYQGRRDPAGALEVFDSLMISYPRLPGTQIAKLFAADCRLALGQAELADTLYEAISLKALPQNYQEELLFRKAEFWFLLGEYDAARTAYGVLMSSFPKSVYVNDCLRRMMLISEHPDMAELELRTYSEALYATFRFDYDSALVLYDKMQHRTDSTLAQLSWFASAEIRELQGNHVEALADFDSLLAIFPQSFYAPFAVEKKGDICAFSLSDYAQAEALYQQVLLDYPKSLNLEEVRQKLRRIKQRSSQQLESSKS